MAGQDYDYLGHTKEYMQWLITSARKCEKHKPELEEECAALENEVDSLEGAVQALKKELEHISGQVDKSSASRDARKMLGDVTSGDKTHEDVILSYNGYFKSAHRHLSKDLQKEEKYKMWKMASDIVMISFEQNKISIIDEMSRELNEVMLSKSPPTTKPLDNKAADLYRAFGMFVNERLGRKRLDEIKAEILQEMKTEYHQHSKIVDDCVNYAAEIIATLDPQDYECFIKENKKRPRLYSVEAVGGASNSSTEMRAYENVKKNECFGCKKSFKRNEISTCTYHLEQYWHQHHCYCAKCQREILDKKFKYLKKTDRVYCSHCLCKKCNEPLLDDEVIRAENAVYHYSCAACIHCHKVKEKMIQAKEGYVCESCPQPS